MFIFIFYIGIWTIMAKIFMNLASNDFRFVFIQSNFHFKNTTISSCDFFLHSQQNKIERGNFVIEKIQVEKTVLPQGCWRQNHLLSRPPSIYINTRTHALSHIFAHTRTHALSLTHTHTHTPHTFLCLESWSSHPIRRGRRRR